MMESKPNALKETELEHASAATDGTTVDVDRLEASLDDDLVQLGDRAEEEGTAWANEIATYGQVASRAKAFECSHGMAEYLPALPDDEDSRMFEVLEETETPDDPEFMQTYVVRWHEGVSKVHAAFLKNRKQ
jgi:hypothetical protein